MEVLAPPAQLGAMRNSLLVAGILMMAATAARSRDSKPADVTVYVKGDGTAPSSVDCSARATVTWIFARAGVRIAWRDGELGSGPRSFSPVQIQVRFVRDASGKASPGALAYSLPFGSGATAITVIYDRIRWAAGRFSREEALLAYVLAHEISHFLEGTDRHAETGIMKARWSGQDYDAMERKQLGFTAWDLALIADGLNAWRTRRVE